MAVPRINIKSMDYFKFKKVVIDGNRDDYNNCSKEIQTLCDCVQTLNFRDEEFDDVTDKGRFEEICTYYRQILVSKRIDPTDMRIKSGWWGDHKNAYSAGKLKATALKEVVAQKAAAWAQRHGQSSDKAVISSSLDGPGLYVLKHREHQCFQYVGRADKVLARFAEKLKAAFEGSVQEPLAALLVISMETDWDFYFTSVDEKDDESVLRILENDLILKHDCIWPHGLNFRLHIDSLLEVSEFRKSCLRHNWPPGGDSFEDHIELGKLRVQVENQHQLMVKEQVTPAPVQTKKSTKTKSKDPWMGPLDVEERSKSAMSSGSGSSPEGKPPTPEKLPPGKSPAASRPKSASQPARPGSAGRGKSPGNVKPSGDKPPLKQRSARPTTPVKRRKPPSPAPDKENDAPVSPDTTSPTQEDDKVEPAVCADANGTDVITDAKIEQNRPTDLPDSLTRSRSSSASSADTYTLSPPPSPTTTPKRSPASPRKSSQKSPVKAKYDKSRLPVVSQ